MDRKWTQEPNKSACLTKLYLPFLKKIGHCGGLPVSINVEDGFVLRWCGNFRDVFVDAKFASCFNRQRMNWGSTSIKKDPLGHINVNCSFQPIGPFVLI